MTRSAGHQRLSLSGRLTVDRDANLAIPAGRAARYGLRPGAEATFEAGANSLLVHRPEEHLAKVYLEPTSRCNLNCRACMRHVWDEPPGDMDAATLDRVVAGLRAVDPTPEVFLGGFGEPLVHPDILGVVAILKKAGARVEMITNGLLLGRDVARELFRLELDGLWVSLDGATTASHGGMRPGGDLATVVENVARFNQLKCYRHDDRPAIGVSFVATRGNLAQLPEVVALGSRLGASRFMVTNLLPHTPEMRDEILFRRALWNRRRSLANLTLPRMDADRAQVEALGRLAFLDELTDYRRADFSATFDTCPFVDRGSVSVRWDGAVAPCLALLHDDVTYLDETRRETRACVMGRLDRRGLVDIWRDPEYLAFRRRIREFDLSPCSSCNSCEMAAANEKDCYGSVHPACGGCLWAQGFIQCP